MTTAVRTAQDCKLTYALTTTPNPLTASPPNIIPGTEDEHAFADIDIVISNTGNTPVRCSRIAIVLPVGSYARDLAVTGEGIDAYVSPETEWTIVDIQSDVLLAIPTTETAVFPPTDYAAEPSTARFEVVPRSGREVNVDGLYIHLSGIKVSTKSGTARIGIEEWATDTEGPLPDVPNTMKLDVAKFPFRSGSDPHPGIGRALVALTATGGPPATNVAAGAPLVLEWHHQRGDNHELYADGKRVGSSQAELEEIAGGSRWEVKAGLRRDTTFALKTSTPTPTSGYVVRWDHVTVCVGDPTLDAVTVSNALQANGNVTVAEGKTLTAGGPVTIAAAQTLTAGGPVNITGDLDAKGHVTATGTGKAVRIRTLYGPHRTPQDEPLVIDASEVVVNGKLSTGTITASGLITANNNLYVKDNGPYTGVLYAPYLAAGNENPSIQTLSPFKSLNVVESVTINNASAIREGDKISLRNERIVGGQASRLLADNKYDSGGYLNVYSYEGYQGSNGNNWFIEKR
ncbi:hypothetical protein [Embleya scabrispora]|uniref:hypothetical protein n=1 Tax=Embleya scabrispora TaxID=159449 RepID=UPI00036C809E|nr:hypothetical protein [Embleya scabrispora]